MGSSAWRTKGPRSSASGMRATVALLCAAVGLLLGAASALDTSAFSSPRYRRLGRVDGDQRVPLAIALKPKDFRTLEEKLYAVSDPRNADYGNHLTKQQADSLAAPDSRALSDVHGWIKSFAYNDAEPSVHFSETTNTFRTSITARQLEKMMGTELHRYAPDFDDAHGRVLVRASTPLSIPEHLVDAIAYVSINTHPMRLRPLATSAKLNFAASEASGGGTLEKIRRLYGIPDDLVVTNDTNSQAMPSFYTESWSLEDLEAFHKQYLPNEPMPRIVEKGDRKNIPDHASIEASLDVEYITGVARNTTTYVWTVNGSNPFSVQDEPFVAFVEAVLELEPPPYVVSISYSDDEEHIFHICANYARSFDTLLIKMGLRGITVLIASGDDGVVGLRPEFNNVSADEACNKHGPQWPSASPYITSVGATMTLGSQTPQQNFFRTNEEVVCSSEVGGMITSGGGFSSIYPMPDYQRRAVEKYLTTKRVPTRAGFFNASGRAYPDLSALGAGFFVQLKKRMTSVSGTSASTPVVGAMVTLWNDIRLNAGKPTLGFINPLIYYLAEHEPTAFNDVVVGSNGASKGSAKICEDSFGATSGWDAVTGVGTPNFSIIADFVRRLDTSINLTAIANPLSSDECNSTGINPTPVSAQDPAENEGSSAGVGIVLLVGSVFIAVAIGAVVAVRIYLKRSRASYASLNVEASSIAREESSNVTPPGSPTQSPRGSIVQQTEDDFDSGKLESGMTEMSEISLHDDS